MHKKLLLAALPLLLVACSLPKPRPISGELQPINKHRVITVQAEPEKVDAQANPPKKVSKKAVKAARK